MSPSYPPAPSPRVVSALPIISLVTVGVATLNSVFVARLIGPEGQAGYASIIAFNAVVALVIGFGTGTTLRLKGRSATDSDRVRYIGYSIFAGAAGFIVAFAWYLLGVSASNGVFGGVLAGIHCSLMVLNAQTSEFNQLDSRIILPVSSVLMAQAVTAIGLAPLFLAFEADLELVLVVVISGFCVQLLFQFRGWRYLRRGAVSAVNARSHLRLATEGAPIVSNLVCIAFLQRGNRMIVPLVASSHVAGLVAAMAVIVEVLRMVPNSLGQGIFLRVSALRRFDRVSFYIALVGCSLSLVLAGILCVFDERLVRVLFGSDYVGASQFLVPLIVAELGISILVIAYRVCLGLGGGRVLSVSYLWLAAIFAVLIVMAVISGSVWAVLWAFAGACVSASILTIIVCFVANRDLRGLSRFGRTT